MPATSKCCRPLSSPPLLILLLLLGLDPPCATGRPTARGVSSAPGRHHTPRPGSKPLLPDNPFWHHFNTVAPTTTPKPTTTAVAPAAVAGHLWAADTVGLLKPNKLRYEGLSDALRKLQDLTVDDVKLRNQFAHRWLYDFLYKLQIDSTVHLSTTMVIFIRRLKTACIENNIVTVINDGDRKSMNQFAKGLPSVRAEEFVILVRAALLEEDYSSMKDELKAAWKKWSKNKPLYSNFTSIVQQVLVEDGNSTLASSIEVMLDAAKKHMLAPAIHSLGKVPVLEMMDNLNNEEAEKLLNMTEKILEAEQLEDLRTLGVNPRSPHTLYII